MSDLFSELNEQQRAAAFDTEGNLRVIAGAGSGKTKVLVSRYLYLVAEYGIDPANILCVTFTNKAAGEMRRRVRAVLGDGYDTALICTYHGFCARLIRDDPQKLFLPKGFQIMDGGLQRSVLGELYQKYELKLDHASFGSFLEKIGRFKRTDEYIPRLFSPSSEQVLPEIASTDDKILEEFLQRQKAIYALDFHDLINGALYLLKQDKGVREKWQDRLSYIQVDEFQDSSAREMELVDLLSEKYKNLMIVGDPDQNIYEWRGSEVKLLVDFDKTHENTKTVFLNRNYRSTPQILSCANHLIEKNQMRLKKDLFTLSPAGEEVVYYHSESDEREAAVLVQNIKEISEKEKRPYSEFAVLYRSGFLSRVVEKKFAKNGIPYEIFGSVKFYQRMEVQDVIAYLRLIAFDDDEAFRRIVNTPRRKFGRAKLQKLEAYQKDELSLFYGDTRPSLFSALENHLGDSFFQSCGAGEFVECIKNLRLLSAEASISEIVNKTTELSGYENYIRGFGDEERLDNLAEFKRIANEYEKNFGEELSLAEFLRQIALQSSEDDEKPKDAVKLMTIHASKGLEFPVVFLIGLSEKIFPSAKTIEERKNAGLEEERRLCYVAITRAKERLFLMDSEGALPKGGYKTPSRFLAEIGTENYRTIGKKRNLLPVLGAAQHTAPAEKEIGERVAHHAFGEGTILSVDDKRQSYEIRFDKSDLIRRISFSYFSKDRPSSVQMSMFPLSAPPISKPSAPPVPSAPTKPSMSQPSVTSAPSASPLPAERKSPLSQEPNLWKRDDVPKTGWVCTGITDIGTPCGICKMCGIQVIRYVHHMSHPDYGSLGVGCVCAGKMQGDIEGAKKREQEFKSRQSRGKTFMTRQWLTSRNGNSYLRIKGHTIVLFELSREDGTKYGWKYAFDKHFSRYQYATKEEAMQDAFDELESELAKK